MHALVVLEYKEFTIVVHCKKIQGMWEGLPGEESGLIVVNCSTMAFT